MYIAQHHSVLRIRMGIVEINSIINLIYFDFGFRTNYEPIDFKKMFSYTLFFYAMFLKLLQSSILKLSKIW